MWFPCTHQPPPDTTSPSPSPSNKVVMNIVPRSFIFGGKERYNGVFLVVYRLYLSLFISLDTIYDDLGREDGTSEACVEGED